MKIVINDANILIDLAELDLLEKFSQLDFELYTTDFVLNELNERQKKAVQKLESEELLEVLETIENMDFQGIQTILANNNGLSFEDCSVWYYSKKLSGTLLTGDGKLRKQAKTQSSSFFILSSLFCPFIFNIDRIHMFGR